MCGRGLSVAMLMRGVVRVWPGLTSGYNLSSSLRVRAS